MVNLVPIGWKNGQPQRLGSGEKLSRDFLELPDAEGQTLTFTHKMTAGGTWTHDLESLSGKIAKLTVDASDVTADGVTVKVDGSTIDTLAPGQKDWYIVEPATSIEVEADDFAGFDLSVAAYDTQSYDFSAQTSASADVRFSPDGTKFYTISGSSGQRMIFQYSLSTPWVLNSGVSYAGSLDISSIVPSLARGFHLSDDGTKLYVIAKPASNFIVYQWNLSSARDIASAAYFNNKTMSMSGDPGSIYLTPELDKMLIIRRDGSSIVDIHQFSVTDGNITTATADSVTLNVLPQTGVWTIGIAWSAARDKFFVVSQSNAKICQYDCQTPGTLAGATFDLSFDLPEVSSPRGLAFTPDGYKFFTATGSTIHRYKSGEGFLGTARVHLSYQS